MSEDANGLPDGWVIVKPDAPAQAQQAKPSTLTGATMIAAGKAAPVIATLGMEAATNPNVPKYMSTAGQIVGGIEGALKEGPLGAAGGAWAGGKAGWFTGKLAQKIGAPIAAVMDTAAPYAQTLSTLGGAAGVGDLAQMADPNRRDVGFLGVGATQPPRPGEPPALMNAALAAIADRMGRPDLAAKFRGR